MLDIKLIRENPDKINELLKEEILNFLLTRFWILMLKDEKFKRK